ncbi:hypothetical protein ACI1TB_05555 [Lactococcus petauri]|uniref:hypothetical protein n=1 Tax=Lactococcus petauri TaxID=1940789 RepID=UPI003852C675
MDEEKEEVVVVTEPNETDIPKPVKAGTDMVDLLVMVVDDLCVQIGDLKEKIGNAQN